MTGARNAPASTEHGRGHGVLPTDAAPPPVPADARDTSSGDHRAGAPLVAAPGDAAAPDPRRDPDDNYAAGATGGRVGPGADSPGPGPAQAEDRAVIAERRGRGYEPPEDARRDADPLAEERDESPLG